MQNGIHEADYIFVVCGETYKEKFDINSKFKDSGVFQEAEYIRDRLNLTGNDISSIFILSFGNINKEHIPKELSRCDKTDCYVDMQLNQLYQHITNQVEAKPKLGNLVKNIPSDIFNNKINFDINPVIDLDVKKEENQNEIIETIKLKNGKSLKIHLIEVKLENKTLYVGKYLVTFEEYDLFCDNTNISKPKDRWGRGEQPLINITWNEARNYCKWLSENTDFIFDLPSSHDWLEVVNRNIFYPNLNHYDIYFNKKKKPLNVKIGGKGDLGICHMYGNVYELCIDEIKINYHIALGGSYITTDIKKFLREEVKQSKGYDTIGFRIFAIK
jgi:hypothetical protein